MMNIYSTGHSGFYKYYVSTAKSKRIWKILPMKRILSWKMFADEMVFFNQYLQNQYIISGQAFYKRYWRFHSELWTYCKGKGLIDKGPSDGRILCSEDPLQIMFLRLLSSDLRYQVEIKPKQNKNEKKAKTTPKSRKIQKQWKKNHISKRKNSKMRFLYCANTA